jgi:hypothetical protein
LSGIGVSPAADLHKAIRLKRPDTLGKVRDVVEHVTQLLDIGLIFGRACARPKAIAVPGNDAMRRNEASKHAHYDDVTAGVDRHGVNPQVADARLQAAEGHLFEPSLLQIAITCKRR